MSFVDDKVVGIQFENVQFEKEAHRSLATLNSLQEALSFKKTKEDLQDFGRVAELTFSDISTNFSALEVMMTGALFNIGNRIADVGIKLVKSLSVDNITVGWRKFGEKTRAVGTLAGQGFGMDEINEQLEKLNWYTDETSYKFNDMVSNISKFTASGSGLEEAVDSMMGIANWAAKSGQNATVAARAMYQVSQSFGAGYFRYQDYRSIQNASMDNIEFRKTAIEAGLALGTIEEAAKGVYRAIGSKKTFTIEDFAGSLTTSKWLTKDVMLKTFEAYGGAVKDLYKYSQETGVTASEAIEALDGKIDDFGRKAFESAQEARTLEDAIEAVKEAVGSGWSTTFTTIFGDYDEAKQLWTTFVNELWDIFVEGSYVRNDLLAEWKDAGGRMSFLQGLWNIFHNLVNVFNSAKEAFANVFPEVTVDMLLNITKNFEAFTEKTYLSSEQLNLLKTIFTGFFSVLDFGKNVIVAVAKGFTPIYNMLKSLASVILDTAACLGYMATEFNETSKSSQFFNTITAKIVVGIRHLLLYIQDLINEIPNIPIYIDQANAKISEFLGFDVKETLVDFFIDLKDSVLGFVTSIKEGNFKIDVFNNLNSAVQQLFATIRESGGIFGFLSNAIVGIGKLIVPIVNFITGAFKFATGLLIGIGQIGPAVLAVIDKVGFVLGNIGTILVDSFSNIDWGKIIDDIFNGAILVAVIGGINSIINAIKNIMPTAILENVQSLTTQIGLVLNQAQVSLESLQKTINAQALKDLAIAVAILTGSLLVLAGIDGESATQALVLLAGVYAEMMTVLAILGSGKIGLSLKPAAYTGLIAELAALSVSVLVLAGALKILSSIDLAAMISSLLAMGLIAIGLLKFLKVAVSLDQLSFSSAFGLLLIAEAIKVLTSAVVKLSKLDLWALVKGIGAIAAVMFIFSTMLKAVPNEGQFIALGTGMLIISVALNLIAVAIAALGLLKFDWLLKGIGSIAAVLLVMVGVIQLLNPYASSMIAISAGIVIFSLALDLIAVALFTIGLIPSEQLLPAFIALISTVVILVAALKESSGLLAGAAGLVVAAAAILIIAPALMLLCMIPFDQVASALILLAGTFFILGQAASLLTPFLPTIAGLAASILVMGLGMSAMAAGIGILIAGLAFFIELFIRSCSEISALLPQIMDDLNALLDGIIELFINAAVGLVELIVVAIDEILIVIDEHLPSINEHLYGILYECGVFFRDKVPELTYLLVEALYMVAIALGESLGGLVAAVLILIAEFFYALGDAILDEGAEIVNSIIYAITALFLLIAEIFGIVDHETARDMLDTAKEDIDFFFKGIGEAIKEGVRALFEAADTWSQYWRKGMDEIFGTNTQVTGDSPFRRGLEMMLGDATDTIDESAQHIEDNYNETTAKDTADSYNKGLAEGELESEGILDKLGSKFKSLFGDTKSDSLDLGNALSSIFGDMGFDVSNILGDMGINVVNTNAMMRQDTEETAQAMADAYKIAALKQAELMGGLNSEDAAYLKAWKINNEWFAKDREDWVNALLDAERRGTLNSEDKDMLDRVLKRGKYEEKDIKKYTEKDLGNGNKEEEDSAKGELEDESTKAKTLSERLSEAKKAYDELAMSYRNGLISRSEFDKQVAALEKEYSDVLVDLNKYIQEQRLKAAKETYDDVLTAYRKGLISLDDYFGKVESLLTEYSDISAELSEYISEQRIKAGKEEYDNLLVLYKKGVISAEEYYAAIESLLNDYADVRYEVEEYVTEQVEKYNKELLDNQKEVFDALLDEYKNGLISLEDFRESYAELLSEIPVIADELTEYGSKEFSEYWDGIVDDGKDALKELVEEFQNGEIKKDDFTKRFLELQKTYADQWNDIWTGSTDTITSYVEYQFNHYKDNFESLMDEIMSSIDNLASNLRTLSFGDMFKFTTAGEVREIKNAIDDAYDAARNEVDKGTTEFASKMGSDFADNFKLKTNKDIYEETVSDYEKKIEDINKKIDESKEKYGEYSSVTYTYQRQLDSLTKQYEKYKEAHEKGVESGEIDEEEVVSVNFGEQLEKETKDIQKYNDDLNKLLAKDFTDKEREYILDLLRNKDRKEGQGLVTYLLGLSDEEMDKMFENWYAHEDAETAIGVAMYKDDMDKARSAYEEAIADWRRLYKDKITDDMSDDDIVQIAIADKLNKETENLKELENEYSKLVERRYGGDAGKTEDMLTTEREATKELVNYIASLTGQNALEVTKYLNSLDNAQFAQLQKSYDDYVQASKDAATALYSTDVRDAWEAYSNEILETWNQLPEEFKDIGADCIKKFYEGFTETSFDGRVISDNPYFKLLYDITGINAEAAAQQIAERTGVYLPDTKLSPYDMKKLVSNAAPIAVDVEAISFTVDSMDAGINDIRLCMIDVSNNLSDIRNRLKSGKKIADVKVTTESVDTPSTKATLTEQQKLTKIAQSMQQKYGKGNVDLTNRPFVSGETMRKAGYNVGENDISTVYTSTEFIWQGDEENGEYVAVHFTPILPNGEVLTEEEMARYLHNTLEGSTNILFADTEGLVLKVDTGLNLTEEDIASLKTGEYTDAMKAAMASADTWDDGLHRAQEAWMNQYFTVNGNPYSGIDTSNMMAKSIVSSETNRLNESAMNSQKLQDICLILTDTNELMTQMNDSIGAGFGDMESSFKDIRVIIDENSLVRGLAPGLNAEFGKLVTKRMRGV